MGLVGDGDGLGVEGEGLSGGVFLIRIQIRIENSLVGIEMLVLVVACEREFLEKRVLREMRGLLGDEAVHLGRPVGGLQLAESN